MDNWYKLAKKQKTHKRKQKGPISPYVIDNGVMKYRTEKGDLMIADEQEEMEKESKKGKKKEWNPNPWAVCHTTVDKDKDPAKFERCVKDVKKKQK